MIRVTMSIDEDLAIDFDRMLNARGYQNRSEGLRDLAREAVKAWENEHLEHAQCVATLSYIYNPEGRGLALRLSELKSAHHDLVAGTTQLHLDHDSILECVILKGGATAVRALADEFRAERGVRFGVLNLIGVEAHVHHAEPHAHIHPEQPHLSPRAG